MMAKTNKSDKQEPETDDEAIGNETDNSTTKAKAQNNGKKFDLKARLEQLRTLAKRHPRRSAAIAALTLAVLILAIPLTRYPVLGLAIKRDVVVTLVDEKTGRPVSAAQISYAGKTAETDGEGKAKLENRPVGKLHLSVHKENYSDTQLDAFVGLRGSTEHNFTMHATGRQVVVELSNAINREAIVNAHLVANNSEAFTDIAGWATLVLPADAEKVSVTISADGYNEKKVELTVIESVRAVNDNIFALTPVGKVYFLSKASGKIDIVKTDLDGANREKVLAGTGKEDDYDTQLYASADWKYLALISRRDGGDNAKLFLISTSDNKLSIIDQGKASFTPYGWVNHHFIYEVDRSNVGYTEAKSSAFKSFNADSKKIIVLDENPAGSYLGDVKILGDELVYDIAGAKPKLVSVRADGSAKSVIQEFYENYDIYFNQYEPKALYIQVVDYPNRLFYKYEDGKLVKDSSFKDLANKSYPIWYVSPSGKQVMWSEERDGKVTLFLGNENGDDAQKITALDKSIPYGWFNDDYILLSKNQSELYIRGKVPLNIELKISNYHRQYYGEY